MIKDRNPTLEAWRRFQKTGSLRRPQSEGEYLELMELMDRLTDHYAPDHPEFGSLFDLIAMYMLEWEQANEPPFEEVPGHVSLKYLMEENGVSQYQLQKEGIVNQGTLNQILRGKRGISKNLAKKLAERFHVSPTLFL